MKLLDNFYQLDCQIFYHVNRYFNNRSLNRVLQIVTHLGGATFTISFTLIMLLFMPPAVQMTAVASAIALAVSHIPVALLKKYYPRKRPYIVLDKSFVLANPLKDHSFPSGHTTAVFSVITPFILFQPFLLIILLPIGCLVGISRVFLGLHFPSDVFIGMVLGVLTAVAVFALLQF